LEAAREVREGTLSRERICRLHCPELGIREFRPGESLRLGRHRDNDVVLDAPEVSRFHARITWDPEIEHPVVFDNGSQNGTVVDGQQVRTASGLKDQARIAIGPFVFKVELLGVGESPAVLRETSDLVTLFSEEGPDLKGELKPTFNMIDLMERLEVERRTGTLTAELSRGRAKVIYCLGRIMSAELGEAKALRAIEKIVYAKPSGSFRFTRELEPQEEAMNLWISDYLRSRAHECDETWDRVKITQRVERPYKKKP
jgi:hypothetical protein